MSIAVQRTSRLALYSPLQGERARAMAARIETDRRRHRRVAIALLGRFMRENRQEYPCQIKDASVGGVGVLSPVDVEIGERVVVYVDELGGLEGLVVRTFQGGFGLKVLATAHKREKLAAQLTFLVNRPYLGELAERRHERVAPGNPEQDLTLADGTRIPCLLVDVSLSGAFVATSARPVIGSVITLGRLAGRVVRQNDDGIGIQFIDVQHPKALRRHFG